MKKQVLFFLLMLMPILASAQTVEINGIYYILNSTKKVAEVTCVPSGTSKYTGSIVISNTVTYLGVTYSVTTIGSDAFFNCSDLTSITIPNSVTSIKYDAFSGCTSLSAVHITDIAAWCRIDFTYTESYDEGEIIYDANPLRYAHHLYLNGELVKDLVIPEGVTSISKCAFSGCIDITSVTIPSSLRSIEYDVFSGCTSLSAVHITDIAAWCRIDFAYTMEYYYGSQPSNYRFYNTNPLQYAHHLYLNGELVKDLIIPEGATSISRYAFSGCTDITSVTFPSSLSSIEVDAFSGCTNFSAVHITDITAWCKIDFTYTYIYYEGHSCERNVVNNNPLQYAHHLYVNGELVKDLVVPEGATSISRYAFSGCTDITSVTFPSSLSSIEVDAFSGCTNFSAVNITDITAWCKIDFSDTEYEVYNLYGSIYEKPYVVNTNPLQYVHHLFLNGELVKDLIIPEGTTSISKYAFSGCTDITSVTFPSSLRSFEVDAFSGCPNFSAVHITDIAAWCKKDFIDTEDWFDVGDNGIVVNTNVVTTNPLQYAHHLYLNGKLVKDLVIPEGVSSISGYAFSGCTDITSVTIPNSMDMENLYYYDDPIMYDYENDPFGGCNSIEKITFHCQHIGQWFSSMSSIKKVIIGEKVTTIGERAFSNCGSLESVVIGKGVTNINSNAFGNCKKLIEVTCLADNVPNAESDAFANTKIENATLYVTHSANDYRNTDPWNGFGNIVSFTPTYELTYIVDDEVYKTMEYEEGESITPEPYPTKEGYIFSGWSEIPETMPAHYVTVTGKFLLTPICATPTITILPNGKIKVECATEGATCITNITATNAEPLTDGVINLHTPLVAYVVTSYATKEGYDDSEVVTATFRYEKAEGDMNGDGMLNITDVIHLVNMILGQ